MEQAPPPPPPPLATPEEESGAVYVVRKGDLVGVYQSLKDCQAQVSSVWTRIALLRQWLLMLSVGCLIKCVKVVFLIGRCVILPLVCSEVPP